MGRLEEAADLNLPEILQGDLKRSDKENEGAKLHWLHYGEISCYALRICAINLNLMMNLYREKKFLSLKSQVL